MSATPFVYSLLDPFYVTGFPPQRVNLTDEGIPTAGYSGYTLICTTTREQDLSPLSTLSVQWLGPDGRVVDGDGFIINGIQGPSNTIMLTSRLTFVSLLPSQTGEYTCRSLLTIPDTEVTNHTVDATITVEVKCNPQFMYIICQYKVYTSSWLYMYSPMKKIGTCGLFMIT